MTNTISVSYLNAYVKNILEHDIVLNDVFIKGEISNFIKNQKSGHYYFTLKDENCNVKSVMFRFNNTNLAFMPQNGMQVIVSGKITLYERDGSFQINVSTMFPDGKGSMELAFNELKDKLFKQGLFDEKHKKPIPQIPTKVGIVTSKTGAALQDILNVINRRFPIVKLLLYPANVQGETAYKEIVQGVETLDKKNVDVIIIARGGGSAEDLWVFNHEQIARAVFNAKTPIISAIGHEIDYTILDFVADLRAPTPSASAEIAVPDINVIINRYNNLYSNIKKFANRKVEAYYNKLSNINNSRALANVKSTSEILQIKLSDLSKNINIQVQNNYKIENTKINNLSLVAYSLNPYNVIKRGYSVASNENGVISNNNLPKVNEKIIVEGNKYKLECKVEGVLKNKNE